MLITFTRPFALTREMCLLISPCSISGHALRIDLIASWQCSIVVFRKALAFRIIETAFWSRSSLVNPSSSS